MPDKTFAAIQLVDLKKGLRPITTAMAELEGLVNSGADSKKISACLEKLAEKAISFVPRPIMTNAFLKSEESDEIKTEFLNKMFDLFWSFVGIHKMDEANVHKLRVSVISKVFDPSS